jgi:hypothetical protein
MIPTFDATQGVDTDPVLQPALSELRLLPPRHLDRVVRVWAARLGLTHLRPCEPLERALTYHGVLRSFPVLIPVRLRVYQRRSRLHAHHVEAFAGHLLRAGISTGILVTTSDFSAAARQVAQSYPSIRLRLYSGEAWATDLAQRRGFLRRQLFWRWILSQLGEPEQNPKEER